MISTLPKNGFIYVCFVYTQSVSFLLHTRPLFRSTMDSSNKERENECQQYESQQSWWKN